MKILVISDEEVKNFWEYYKPGIFKEYELIISCGDLSAKYLEFIVTMASCPVVYVPGNHDSSYVQKPPEGCDCIDGKIFTYNGVRFLGLGGSMKYRPDQPYLYTEDEMRKRIQKLKKTIIKHSGFDILVTHSPAKGYRDLEDLPHNGFECLNELMNCCQPQYMIHGHVHANYGQKLERELQHPSGTTIINCFEKYVLEFDENNKKIIDHAELKTKWAQCFKNNHHFGFKKK